MNIIEKYIENKKSLIILISGFSGSGKTVIGKSLAKDLKLDFVNLNDFYKDDFKEYKQVGNLNVIAWDSPDAINWDKFNKYVDEKIKKVNGETNSGLVISGFAFPESKLKIHVDFHVHLKISKDDLIKNRQDFTSERVDSKLEGIKDLTPEIEKRILNAISFPIYLEMLKQSKFTKTINIEYGKLKDAYNDVFDYIIESIKKLL
jgi:uridine kinase